MHHNTPATNTTTGHNVLHNGGDPAYNGTTTTTGHHGHTGPGPALGAAGGAAAGHHEGHTATGAVLGGIAGHHHAKNHPDAHTTAPASAAQGGTGPAGAGAGEKMLVGKLEHAAGTVLCSSTLKAKGLEKEQEAQALKAQSAEIGAAERLEGEAGARRERAVAHGAHPHHLGGGAGGAQAPAGGGVGHTGYAGGPTNVGGAQGGAVLR